MELKPIQAGTTGQPAKPDPARVTAERFEASFLAEMLKYSGINQSSEVTGGGAGEDAFSSFLTEEYANLLAARGGVGLAEQIFHAMEKKGSDQ